jgi:cytochrome P450
MSRITTQLKDMVRSRIMRRVGPIDLRQIQKVPDRLIWPLLRDGFDPLPRLGEVREASPVTKHTSFVGLTLWLVTGDAECRQVLANSTDFSNDIRHLVGQQPGQDSGVIGGLGFTDPPDHTRLRKFLTPEFTMRRLERLRPGIESIVADRLDALEDAGADADLVRDFAFPVPFLVICELLGLPDEERETFRALTSARFDVSGGGAGTFGAISGSREYLMDFVARQRLDPGDGLVGQIIREHGDAISDFDLAGLADGAFTGGLETSASMLALGTAVLLERPDLYRRLADEPDLVAPTVDELLRYLSVVQIAFPRFAKTDLEIGGQLVKKGDVVICHLAAAGRDRRVGADDDVDPHRRTTDAHASGHLAFGYGFHRCVGAELAKIELRIAYPAQARRFPDLAARGAVHDFREKSIVYGLESMPVDVGV